MKGAGHYADAKTKRGKDAGRYYRSCRARLHGEQARYGVRTWFKFARKRRPAIKTDKTDWFHHLHGVSPFQPNEQGNSRGQAPSADGAGFERDVFIVYIEIPICAVIRSAIKSCTFKS